LQLPRRVRGVVGPARGGHCLCPTTPASISCRRVTALKRNRPSAFGTVAFFEETRRGTLPFLVAKIWPLFLLFCFFWYAFSLIMSRVETGKKTRFGAGGAGRWISRGAGQNGSGGVHPGRFGLDCPGRGRTPFPEPDHTQRLGPGVDRLLRRTSSLSLTRTVAVGTERGDPGTRFEPASFSLTLRASSDGWLNLQKGDVPRTSSSSFNVTKRPPRRWNETRLARVGCLG